MINLLPTATKHEYRYAARNVVLLRWISGGLIALVGLGLIGGYGLLSLRSTVMSSDAQIASLEANLDDAQLKQTNAKVVEIGNGIKLVEKVLSQEILFSQLLKRMASALPAGTSLTGLNIAQVSSGSGLDVTIDAADYETATQVQINLADGANQIFAKADIQSITCDASASANTDYPCKIVLRAQFAQNNQFLFINQKQAAQ